MPGGKGEKLSVAPDDPRIVAMDFGDRVTVINDTPLGHELKVRLAGPLPDKHRFEDAADGAAPEVAEDRVSLSVRIRPYDVKTLLRRSRKP
jgi:hypothetical protein